MRLFRVEFVNDVLNVGNADFNTSKNVTCARGGDGRDSAVILKNFAITGEKFVKTDGLFLKVGYERAII